ncbi:helicase domain-containing protein [Desulfonatronum parangueonense]
MPQSVHASPVSLAVNHELQEKTARDSKNAILAKQLAKQKRIESPQVVIPQNFTGNVTRDETDRREYKLRELAAFHEISEHPFQAMVEVITETEDERDNVHVKKQLWYANEKLNCNIVLGTDGNSINILSWTHPGLQAAISRPLNSEHDLDDDGLTLLSVKPLVRARYDQVIPEVIGIYEPLGRTRMEERPEPKTGLKAVKLNMTPDQISAFISKMDGLLFVTGAPGSGKTTVAFQRARFLINEYLDPQRQKKPNRIPYTPEHTRIFLGNQNLVEYSRSLLTEGLDLPAQLVELVPKFINAYLGDIWQYKHDARARPRRLPPLETRARMAFFGLGTPADLKGIWNVYELQIIERLKQAMDAAWVVKLQKDSTKKTSSETLATALSICANISPGNNPIGSRLRLDDIYQRVSGQYEEHRNTLKGTARENFDNLFKQWIYHVYDPFDALKIYWSDHFLTGKERMKAGTASRIETNEILQSLQQDWEKRYYGPEEEPWLAWLLRFAMPERMHHERKFKEIPSAFGIMGTEDNRWTHVVIDEAQDLCVAEASIIGSLVHPMGALTVSADFKQIVSPVWGMTDMNGFSIGNKFFNSKNRRQYPFARNMRQSQQIGLFLESFYQAAFGERARFEAGNRIQDIKPQLLICPQHEFSLRIKQVFNLVNRSPVLSSIALLQINEDQESMERLRDSLKNINVPLANIWESKVDKNHLVTTSVERIKGLEFDACIVLGLDDVERASLNFTTNRAYVALSRPTRRLAIICEHFPRLLQNVNTTLFETIRSN